MSNMFINKKKILANKMAAFLYTNLHIVKY